MTADAPYSLLKELGDYNDQRMPPVADWHPETCRSIDIRIDRAGRWFHEGSQIHRQRMVRLFSRVLRKEGESYFLVTPVEKCRIQVADVPFVAILMDVSGQGRAQTISFTTNVGDRITLDSEHPLRMEFDPATREPAPYVRVREDLDALLNRNVYYNLANLLVADPDTSSDGLGVWSAGRFFRMSETEGGVRDE